MAIIMTNISLPESAAMDNLDLALDAALCAVLGESNVNVVLPALQNKRLALIIALAPDAHPIVRAIAALRVNLRALLNTPIIGDSALHDAVARFIGTTEGRDMLWTFAHVAPAGWGATHADALITTARNDINLAVESATLIGPRDDSAALLHRTLDMVTVIGRWGKSTPDNPTAWMDALSSGERDRLLDALRKTSFAASCLPWLPPDRANQTRIDDAFLNGALEAFAKASPTARSLHAALLQRLIARASPKNLAALTRLACAIASEDAWERVPTLIQTSPDAAYDVVTAAPWNNVAEEVRTTILDLADRSDVCAAIAAAQGRGVAPRITSESANAFFAALDPKVWDALPAAEQRQWRDALPNHATHLAVRSLGPRPEFLAQAKIDDDIINAVQRHACDENAVRVALFPVAIREADIADAHGVIDALPTMPSDPGAFFVIASGRADPSVIPAARTTLQTPADVTLACIMQRCTKRNGSIRMCGAALRRALRRRTWKDLTPIMALLDDNARAALMPDPDALIERLAHPDHQEALRQALERLESLPPEVVIPTRVALAQARSWTTLDAAGAIADALHAHGDVFLSMIDALADNNLRTALLPLPEDTALANALRTVARSDLSCGRHLAIALNVGDQHATLHALLTLHPSHAIAVWKAMAKTEQHAIASALSATLPIIDALAERDPIAALALMAIQSDDSDLRNAGVNRLVAHSDAVRGTWNTLPQEMRQLLGEHPAFADLQATLDRPNVHRAACRRIS